MPTPPRRHVTRRSFIQLSGAGLGAVALSNFLTACGNALGIGEDEQHINIANLSVTEWIAVRRPDDLLVVDFGLVNLKRVTIGGVVHLVKRRLTRPALLVARLPPQHLAEEYAEAEPPNSNVALPVQHVLAGDSRLVFNLGTAPQIPLSIDGLLAACAGSGLNVAATAAAPAGSPDVGGSTSGTNVAREPDALETSLEMPFRIALSPNQATRFVHATAPVAGPRQHVELWHTRLAAGRDLRWMRALHDHVHLGPDPFPRMLPDAIERDQIVRASSSWQNPGIAVERVALSALGAWFEAGFEDRANVVLGLASWDQKVAMGRDVAVRIVTDGRLWPLCHKAPLIQTTKRKMTSGPNPVAYLEYEYHVDCVEPVRHYHGPPVVEAGFERRWPFSAVRILTRGTPKLDGGIPNTAAELVPMVGGQPFVWQMEAVDRRGELVRFAAPLIWLPEGTTGPQVPVMPGGPVDLGGQRVSFTEGSGATADEKRRDSRAAYETRSLTLSGEPYGPNDTPFYPRVESASIVVDALAATAGVTAPVDVVWADAYIGDGFDRAPGRNPHEAILKFAGTAVRADFIKAGTDTVGGFVAPNLVMAGLSRLTGPLPADLVAYPPNPASPTNVFPLPLGNALDAFCPRIFGCISLIDLLDTAGVSVDDLVPKFATEAMDEVNRLIQLAQRLKADAINLYNQLTGAAAAIPAALADIKQHALELQAFFVSGANGFVSRLEAEVDKVKAIVNSVNLDTVTDQQIEAAFSGLLDTPQGPGLFSKLKELGQKLANDKTVKVIEYVVPYLGAGAELLRTIRRAVTSVVDVAETASEVLTVIKDALKGMVRARDIIKDKKVTVDWRPKLKSPLIQLAGVKLQIARPDALLLSAELRAKQRGNQKAGADVLCSLDDFRLELFGIFALDFKRMQFRRRMGQKPEIDIVFKDIVFMGALSFVQTIKDIIPLDGFSDPPSVTVDEKGLVASFTAKLPSIAVGMFTFDNMGIVAKATVPFLGDAPEFSLSFASKENPFSVTMAMFGGGGSVELVLTPAGMKAVVVTVFACAQLSLDVVVASGSVSARVGFGLLMSGQKVNLTGFFHLCGALDVLGLVSLSIVVHLELEYSPTTDKLYGEATVEVEVSVSFFTIPVGFTVKRQLAGANSDPPFQQLVPEPLFDEYLAAFAA